MSRMPELASETVGVMGSGLEAHDTLAMQVGQLLARLAVNLLTGGGDGVMRSVSRAFVEAKPRRGISIGILPCGEQGPLTLKRGYPNEFVQLAICTHLPHGGERGGEMTSRNHINVLSSSAIVALPGAAGTASEVRLAVEYEKPVIIFAPVEQVKHFTASVRRTQSIDEVERFLRSVLPPSS